MRFSLLSGAYKNSGDYLIVERSKALLRYVFLTVKFMIM